MDLVAAVVLPPLFPLHGNDSQPSAAPLADPSAFIDRVDTPPTGPVQVRIVGQEMPFVNAAQHTGPEYVKDWEHFIGQEPMKRQLQVYIDDAEARMDTLPHILLASTMPGAGKTTLARLIAKQRGARLTMLVPPFTPQTLYDAALQMRDWEILFIDEIHKLADHGPAAAENLYHMMEEGMLYLDDGTHVLADFTVIGATTDAGKLPEAALRRFGPKPFFQAYSEDELVKITNNFCEFFDVTLLPETTTAISKACSGTPSDCRDLVVSARALQNSTGHYCTPTDLLTFNELEPDGTTRKHKAYLLALYQFFGRDRDGEWEYVAGEATLMSLLRENKVGLSRLERFLVERGLMNRSPQGRRLTDNGVARAKEYFERGQKLGSE